MRVLDLGTGLGHVAFAAADLVGAEGRVVGVDNNLKLLGVAIGRASAHPQVRFVEGDVRTWRSEEPFDAVIGRLILFHLPDRLAVLRHHVAALRPGGLVVALDFDLGRESATCRSMWQGTRRHQRPEKCERFQRRAPRRVHPRIVLWPGSPESSRSITLEDSRTPRAPPRSRRPRATGPASPPP